MQLEAETYTNNSSRNVLVSSFVASVIAYVIFLSLRGFGWDGDSVVSAMQFIKLINPDIFGLVDDGTFPKLLCIVLFGLLYLIFGTFKVLTIVSIILNCGMIACLCKWTSQYSKIWWIALFGLLLNVDWHLIVINCDNSAFSIPFLIFGLCFYFFKGSKAGGTVLLVVSNLFRPGAEFVLAGILLLEISSHNKKLRVCAGILAAIFLCLLHSRFGMYLAYPTERSFYRQCYQCYETFEKHTFRGIWPYIKNALRLVTFTSNVPFLVLGFLSVVKAIKAKVEIRYLLLAPLATIILPIGTYFYGTTETITYDKMMEFSIILPVFAALNPYLQALLERIPRKVKLPVIIYLSVCLFLVYAGIRCKGLYEVNNDGTGSIKWKQYDKANAVLRRLPHQKFHALVSNDNKFFFVLDNGLHAKSIDIIEHTEKPDTHNEHYDVLLLSKTSLQTLPAESLSKYRGLPLDDENYLYLSHRFEQDREVFLR